MGGGGLGGGALPSFYTELGFDCSHIKEAQTHKYHREMNLQ